jgi:hypothetical protein
MTPDELLQTRVTNPYTKRKVTVRYALRLPHDHPAYREAVRVVQRNRKKPSATKPRTDTKSTKHTPTQLRSPDPAIVRVIHKALGSDAWTPRELQTFGKKYMNGISPINIVAQYLKTFGVTRSDQIKKLYFLGETDDFPSLSISIQLTDGTKLSRTFTRRRTKNEWIVEHDHFALGDRVDKGQGLGKRMLRDTLAIADELNIVAAKFSAGLESGGYVWARYGGIPDPGSRRRIMKRIQDQVVNVDRLKTTIRTAKRVAESRLRKTQPDTDEQRQLTRSIQLYTDTLDAVETNPKVVATIHTMITADLKKDSDKSGRQMSPELLSYIANTPLGKYLLLGTEWEGYFNLRRGSLGRRVLEQSITE